VALGTDTALGTETATAPSVDTLRPVSTPEAVDNAHIDRLLMRALALAYCLLAAGLTSTAALADLRREVPMSDTITSFHSSFFGWMLLAFSLIGALTHQLKRSTLFIAGQLAIAVGAVLFGAATVPAMSLIGALLFGGGAAALVTTIPTIVAQRFSHNRGEVFTRLNAAPGLAGMGLPLVMMLVAALQWSWRLPILLVTPLLALPALFGSIKLARAGHLDPQERPQNKRTSPLALLRIAPVRARFIMQVLCVGAEFAIGSWIVVLLSEEGGVSAGRAPIAASAWGLAMFVGRMLTPQLTRLLGGRMELVVLSAFTLTAVALTAARNPVMIVLAVLAVSLSLAPIYTLGVDRLFATAHAAGFTGDRTISALGSAASGIGIIVAPTIVGFVSDRSTLRSALLLPAFMTLCCVWLTVVRWQGEAGQLGQTAGR
jgi:predicted MFS family arabinose efflux permease